mmetsp:Transcript_741/g.1183  ORF Transcript_741/g.1183 Transcript_741/m.1183 type:complete len:103 (-) Transcript_741:99-407(-)
MVDEGCIYIPGKMDANSERLEIVVVNGADKATDKGEPLLGSGGGNRQIGKMRKMRMNNIANNLRKILCVYFDDDMVSDLIHYAHYIVICALVFILLQVLLDV